MGIRFIKYRITPTTINVITMLIIEIILFFIKPITKQSFSQILLYFIFYAIFARSGKLIFINFSRPYLKLDSESTERLFSNRSIYYFLYIYCGFFMALSNKKNYHID
jgi:hypothetical protein